MIRGVDEDYRARQPGPEDVGLVIEVADSTLARDRGIKLRNYARAGIVIYWIVDLVGRQVEVYTVPAATLTPPAYQQKQIFDERATLPLELAGQRIGEIAVSTIFA